MSSDNKGEMIQISGLWLNESKNGEKYFTGYMGNAKILIFKNKFKEADNQPDYIFYLAPKPKPEDQDNQDTTPSKALKRGRNDQYEDFAPPPDDMNDIPF